MATEKPDVEKFLNDPAFQGDRALFTALIDKRIAELRALEEKQRQEQEASEETIFDRWFGRKG